MTREVVLGVVLLVFFMSVAAVILANLVRCCHSWRTACVFERKKKNGEVVGRGNLYICRLCCRKRTVVVFGKSPFEQVGDDEFIEAHDAKDV